MPDADKTKEEMMRELKELRQRIVELEASEAERKRAEEELRERENYLNKAQQIAHFGGWIWDVEANRVEFSDEMFNIFGITKEQFVGTPEYINNLVIPEDRARVKECAEDLLIRHKSTSMEYSIMRPDGSVRHLWGNGEVELDKEGKLHRIIGTVLDITEGKRAEEKLNRMSDAVNMAKDSIVIADLEARILDVNESTLRMYGVDNKSDLVGKNLFDFIAPEEREIALEDMKETLEKGHTEIREYHIVPKDGSRILVEMSAAVIKDTAGTPIGFVGVSRNISVRKVKEKEYQNIIHTTTDGFWVVDAQGRFLDVNEAYCALIGYSREELLNMSVADIEAIDTVEDIVQRIQRIIKSGHDCFETRHRCKNGKIVGIEICTTYMGADDGRLVVFARDISERKRAEEALRESEERYRSLVNNISMGQFRSTPEPGGRFLEVNPSMERITGYSREELLHMDVSDLYLWSEERQRVIEDIVSTIGVPTRELHFKKKDGAAITVSSTTVAVRNDDGQVVYFDGIVEDITERKRAEEKLKRAEENFRRSMDDSPLGIRIVAVDGELLYANKAILDIYGYSSIQELKDTPAKQRYTPEAYAEHRERARKRKTGEFVPSSYEISIVRKDGQVRHLHVFRKEVLWNGERQFQVLYQDITGRKLMEEEEQKLERLESVGILAGGIAHDFNNILTGILGNVTLAKRHVETKSRAAERLLEAEKACLRAKDLTQQLLTFSKGGAPVKKIASIAELLEETAAFALRGSKVKCEFSLPDDLWVVEVDQGQMSQVITNIVINADEAMPGGGIINIGARNTVIKRKEALPLPKGDYVEIAVKDYGVGVSKEHLDRIFDPYFTTKRKGSGLGLATAYSVVSNHHGYITVESELGVGTTFHIYLPASGKPALEKKEAARAVPVHGKGRILVMDDEEIIRKMLSKMLSLAGYGVEVTGNGVEAVELYQKARESGRAFDAVILDLTVPGGMGGKEAMKKLLEIDPEVKAIVSSGYATDPIMADFYKYGFSAVVAKPYSVGELERALHRMLR